MLIDLSNYATSLVQSVAGRAGSPDGNVYFNKASGLIEFIRADELADIDLTSKGVGTAGVLATATTNTTKYIIVTIGTTDFTLIGAASNTVGLVFTATGAGAGTGTVNETTPNPLDVTDGIKFEAAYAFENQERAIDEDLRKYDRWTEGTFKFGGAYNYINSRKPSTDADREIKRGSGWNEVASDGGIDRIYFGNKGLSNIEVTSQPYFQLAIGGAPTDFAKLGQIDEAVQVFGDTGNVPSDAGAGNFDTRTYEAVSVRTFGQNYDRKETTTDLGIAELGGYSTGFALNESVHLTSGAFALADVYGGAIIAPWDTMTLTKLASAQVETGFNEADGNFIWTLNNPGTGSDAVPVSQGSLDQCVAFLDALAQTDDDIDTGAITVTNGKRVGTWYSYNATGQVVFNAPFASEGLYVENIPVADEQNAVFVDDADGTKTRPFVVGIEATIGATAKADVNAWFHSFFAGAFNTAGALTVEDSSASEIKGLASTADVDNKIIKAFDYDGDTIGGTAGTDKDAVWLTEGDGGATQAKTLFTITRQTTIAFACVPGVENNV